VSSTKDRLVAEKYRAKIDDEEIAGYTHLVKDRFEKIRDYITGGDSALNKSIGINMSILTNALYSYFYDLERLHDFHASDGNSYPKQAAYLIKWLIKEKPVWFDSEIFLDNEHLELLCEINEFLALRMGLGIAGIKTSQITPSETENLVYEFVFRNHHPGLLSLWFEKLMIEHEIPLA